MTEPTDPPGRATPPVAAPTPPAPPPTAPDPAARPAAEAPAAADVPPGGPAGYPAPQHAGHGAPPAAAPHPGAAPYPGAPAHLAAPYPGAPYPGGPVAAPPALTPGGQPLAGFGIRLGAYLLDGLILGLASLVVALPLMLLAFGAVAVLSDADAEPEPAVVVPLVLLGYAVLFALMFGLSWVYHVELVRRTGQTLGKRLCGIRIVPLDPRVPLTRGMLGLRWLIATLPGVVVPFWNLLDGLWQLWDKPYQQCLHDKVARTAVVVDPR
ncbi:hypothetical protein GCM10010123_29920 [Pilimelia anulata]|uniref:RDD domain-containing protein n=1 Tax=Pilimelia anulata TaxID=53371 RepID=A0A8J3BED0_9ACTN|nr:RDD family protein [Pilimelia anulata]GGJ97859.1 hypothetical protein GCM10010123_29920 [Pilimelia anulata]